MTINELNEEQRLELKQHLLCERSNNVSYGELLEADELVSDEELFNEYSGFDFSPEDFFN